MNKPDRDKVRRVLSVLWDMAPATETHQLNLGEDWRLRLLYQLKVAGFDWSSIDQVADL